MTASHLMLILSPLDRFVVPLYRLHDEAGGHALFKVSRAFIVLQVSSNLVDEAAKGKHVRQKGTNSDCTTFFGW